LEEPHGFRLFFAIMASSVRGKFKNAASVDDWAFTVVNEGLYFIPKSDSPDRHSIQFLNFSTKKIRCISTIDRDIDEFLSVSPQGGWILYSQIDQMDSDLMRVENFR
jgi:hypothetical protein